MFFVSLILIMIWTSGEFCTVLMLKVCEYDFGPDKVYYLAITYKKELFTVWMDLY